MHVNLLGLAFKMITDLDFADIFSLLTADLPYNTHFILPALCTKVAYYKGSWVSASTRAVCVGGVLYFPCVLFWFGLLLILLFSFFSFFVFVFVFVFKYK